MKVNKAVITAAGRAQRSLPLHRFVDRDGQEKTALQIIIEEVLAAGVQEIAVVICPGDEAAYREAAGSLAGRLCFMEQDHPRGYGDALLRARSFVDNEAFAHLVSDHLYISGCGEALWRLVWYSGQGRQRDVEQLRGGVCCSGDPIRVRR
ncbi:MAG: sugar phosphate nucleotidyltransferase, partial [Phycisphaerae bacterium]